MIQFMIMQYAMFAYHLKFLCYTLTHILVYFIFVSDGININVYFYSAEGKYRYQQDKLVAVYFPEHLLALFKWFSVEFYFECTICMRFPSQEKGLSLEYTFRVRQVNKKKNNILFN